LSLTLVLGGTRSGKSAHAERLALASSGRVHYVATASAADPSMADRINAHAARRPAQWTLAEAGDELVATLAATGCSLIDGLGTWVAGVLHRAGAFDTSDTEVFTPVAKHIRGQMERLIEASRRIDLLVVAEDAGHGVLPADAGSRVWLDLLGEATQTLSAAAERVDLVIAGQVMTLTDQPKPVPPELRHHGDKDVRRGDADHAVNVLAGGPPPWLTTALSSALADDASRYPDENAALQAVAAMHAREPNEVVITNGAAEALWLLGLALRPRLAVCVHPGFTETEAGLRAHGIPVARVLRNPEAGFALDPAAVPDAADLVVVGNPASPSGTLDPAAALLALRRPGRTVVVDEAFMSMAPGEPCSLVSERLDDMIVIRSLTKVLSIPGLRVGYALAPEPLADRIRAVRSPWSANALALASLVAAASHSDELAALALRAERERTDLEQRLSNISGVRTWPSVTNFLLIEVADGPRLAAALRDQGIAVRPAGSFPGLTSRHLRLTARDPDANERLTALIASALA
jgi:histidinol-phosphate/aromatic aminotransferase/cobyric acid decarboxylase-like protein/adenosyl cobinamide kinase/adenosyl cobinamide phosphate guanylyltransferase